jgi:hypothetical protein
MKENKIDYSAILEEKIKTSKPTQTITLEGIGTIEVYGNWNAEKIIKKLLEYEEITG